MNINEAVTLALAEAALPHDQCMACERQGLPILPLRRALVPDTRPQGLTTVAGSLHVSAKLGVRTLRMGYLYVLLDQQVWHAYEVSEQGHLRRFNPYEPSEGLPASLPEKCVNENHDIPSSFLNIDTDRYGSAWLAFSSDPWPVSVLDAYKTGQAPAHRFEGVDLAQARNNPELLGIAMTPDNLRVDKEVFEYAQHGCSPFDSAHGFHTRWLRRFALKGYLVNAMNRHTLEKGVLAVVLDDTVGLIQEFNHQRLSWVVKRQAWREDPMRAYQLQTSQILQVIRATHREWAAQKVPSLEPMTGDGPPVFTDPTVERQRLVERAQLESDERLEERYDEAKRAAFQAGYGQQEAEFQGYIDKNARAYVALFDTPMFKVAEQYDYDGDHRESGVAYAKTMALCLGGGITETVAPDAAPAAGTSETLWLKWLKDPDSPPYRALLMRDRALLAGLLPSFSATDVINWNDSDKFYGMLSKVIGSDDAGLRMRNTLKQAIAETQGALNAASQRLAPSLPPGIQNAVRHLNSATQYLYNGVHLIELEVKMKLGEYYALQSAHLRELQHKANASIAEARDRMHRNIDDFDLHSTKAWNKVRPIMQHGLMSLAVLDPRFTHTMISVTVWVEGTAEEVRGRLLEEANMKVTQASSAAQIALVDVSVVAGTLETNARKVLKDLRITSQQAAKLVRTGFSGLRGVAASWEVLLAIGGLYLQHDSLARNQQKAELEIGPKALEAKLALQGSLLGILGGQIELVGLLMRSSGNYIKAPWSKGVAVSGVALVRGGALFSAVAGIFDTAQAVAAAMRASAAGDGLSLAQYRWAVGFFGFGTLAFAGAVFNPLIIGPLGIAIILTLSGYALSKRAEKNESTALERWARRSFFGRSGETPLVHWNVPEFADIAFAELNAATLGVQAVLHFESKISTKPGAPKIGGLVSLEVEQKLKFQVVLPQYRQEISAYRCDLIVHRHGDGDYPEYKGGETLVSESYHADGAGPVSKSVMFSDFSPPPLADYKSDISVIKKLRKSMAEGGEIQALDFTGVVELYPTLGTHSIAAATLLVMYWPDRSIPGAYVEICDRREND
ncbi:T6SS effector BTH_I2691 family protein [Pseudomonas kurunegalensis]|uniref:T6SS effector BTH_I2691 family protein n=1 Tax=Pseudomonas kurunegalensis TaxID=485880 RepID=UPI00257057FD|nr:T6SS effector BTH_I2691 family protein [Pseudomonas kurunegalensis]WJD60058.1 T6SS effector BTH_I2691 family protein [Pseudomonas kurunegalensis]